MAAYLIQRVIGAIVVLLVVTLCTFVVFDVLPSGDPVAARAGIDATPAVRAAVRHDLQLDKPLLVRYSTFLGNLIVNQNLGYSYRDQMPVAKELLVRLPATLSLVLGAMVLSIIGGLVIGCVAAYRPGSLVDRAISIGTIMLLAGPVFVLGTLLLYGFGSDVGAVPLASAPGSYVPLGQDPSAWFSSLVLPWVTLALPFTGVYAQYVRTAIRDAAGEGFVLAARARGVPAWRILVRHALRARAAPLLTIIGVDIGYFIGAALIVELVFDIPGVGQYALQAVQNGDLPAIEGTVLLSAIAVVVSSLLVDLAYVVLDPRVRLNASRGRWR
jgi:peptide/nickel transport system permease protein